MIGLTVWMNMPSFYQDELFRTLAATREVDLRVIFARELARERKDLGWIESTSGYENRTLQSRFAVHNVIETAWRDRKRTHIVNGIWAEPTFATVLGVLGYAESRFAVLSEPPDPTITRSGIKIAAQRGFGRWVATRAGAHVMPISARAANYFAQLGFSDQRTYPFIYSRSAGRLNHPPREDRPHGEFTILYVGQLIDRKGVDLVIRAIASLAENFPGMRLSLVGRGPSMESLKLLALAQGVSDRVDFEGALASSEVVRRMSIADVVILPSRWDGWGLVVNEALSAGTPVLVSSHCGAKDIVEDGVNGYIFESGNVDDLRTAIQRLVGRQNSNTMSESARRTGRSLSVESVVPYLVQVLRHMAGEIHEKPTPPWLSRDTP